MNTDKDDVGNILLADVPWIDQRDVILAMLSAAHTKGQESMALSLRLAREEGLREALYVARDCATESGDWIAAAIERLLERPPMNPARAWPLDKLSYR